MRHVFLLLLFMLCASLQADDFQSFTIRFPEVGTYTPERHYGYDLNTSWDGKSTSPFFFSLDVPDGNYRVTVQLGSKKRAANTTVRAESRRLLVENVATAKGKTVTRTFLVNKRNTQYIDANGKTAQVLIKESERPILHWDNRLTFEINGEAPAIVSLTVERDTTAHTLYLCGNSTVVDQPYEPWASWGQMIPRFLSDSVAVANYAESGLAVATFIGQKRWDKIKSLLRPGDYVLVEFGHNDQKTDARPGNGAYYAFSHLVKQMCDETRAKGATFLLCTPTMRRSFRDGKVQNTHKDYPEAIRTLAQREQITLVDLQQLTGVFYEAMGEEDSKKAFVHYPANTWPDQPKALADNTHFNTYGAYEIAKMVGHALLQSGLPIAAFVDPSLATFDPAHPDDVTRFSLPICPLHNLTKPDGN